MPPQKCGAKSHGSCLQGAYSLEKEKEKSNDHANLKLQTMVVGALEGDIHSAMKILIGKSL